MTLPLVLPFSSSSPIAIYPTRDGPIPHGTPIGVRSFVKIVLGSLPDRHRMQEATFYSVELKLYIFIYYMYKYIYIYIKIQSQLIQMSCKLNKGRNMGCLSSLFSGNMKNMV